MAGETRSQHRLVCKHLGSLQLRFIFKHLKKLHSLVAPGPLIKYKKHGRISYIQTVTAPLRGMMYSALTEAQKREQFTKLDRRIFKHELTSCRHLSECCKVAFWLQATLEKRIIARFVKAVEKTPTDVSQAPSHGLISKIFCPAPGISPKLEIALFSWVCNQIVLSRMSNGWYIVA